ncbi:MAG: class I SAM-dependent methyltransferase [Chloroflexi bacterium]|nr:class I SAM-dependent methyltransferase [Chloroflexota bacterium]MBC7316062.1 class I SAM-dependent methyltransferase [Chloroflexota bacterium]
MTNPFHEANRKGWDAVSKRWQADPALEEVRRRCIQDPSLALGELELRYLGEVRGKRIAVLGSGDHLVVFALAGMGAQVTSVDISQVQLDEAARRAEELGLKGIAFLRADVTDLSVLKDGAFDIVYTGGHVAIWVSDLRRFYREGARILKRDGLFLVNEYHPFRRVWADVPDRLEIGYPYYHRGPYVWDRAEEVPGAEPGSLTSYEYHWTVEDYVAALLESGCRLKALHEWGARSQTWEIAPVRDLPEWLLLVGVKE